MANHSADLHFGKTEIFLQRGLDRKFIAMPTDLPDGQINRVRHCERSEAIHRATKGENGLLRRFRLRSLSYGGQVAPRNDGNGG
jgi:hypothetical protein